MVVWPGVSWSVADVARGWARGLRALGVDVCTFRLDRRVEWLETAVTELGLDVTLRDCWRMAAESFLGAMYEMQPDVVVVVSGWHLPPDTYRLLKDRGVKVVLVHTESPYQDVRMSTMAWCADLHLVNDPVGALRMREMGVEHAYYTHHCYDPAVHHPATEAPTRNVVFCGSGFAGRGELLSAVDWEALGGLTLAGQWHDFEALDRWWDKTLPSPLPNEQTADLYRAGRLGLNIYRDDYIEHPDLVDGWAVGPREIEMAACGLVFARQARPESDRLFPMLPTFSDADELADICAWWLAHDDERATTSTALQAAVADRTFDNNARGLLGLVEKVWGRSRPRLTA
jgi:hypothetical protein